MTPSTHPYTRAVATGQVAAGLAAPVRATRAAFDALATEYRARAMAARLTDPVLLVRAYPAAEDREIAGLIAALLAYGRVDLICRAASTILQGLGPSPRAGLLEGRHRRAAFAPGFVYRFHRRCDLAALLEAVAQVLREEGSLGRALQDRLPPAATAARASTASTASMSSMSATASMSTMSSASPTSSRAFAAAEGLDGALALLAAELRSRAIARAGRERERSLRHLLPDPSNGSAGKRWRLYLRWMIRPEDGVDCGAWSGEFSPAALTLPLDTHWIRLGPRLGWTTRRTPGLVMAQEITAALRRLRPTDPLYYDLPACHFAIAGGCPPRRTAADCRACPLRRVCRTGRESAP